MTDRTGICVLGMHRSGTSLTARILNLMGFDLGPQEHLVRPRSDNPSGFWEHRLIVQLNDRILARFGGGSYHPPKFPPGWEMDPALDNLKSRAIGLIEQDFAASDLWAWKDPRTCLTLPFWQQLLPSLRYVLCFRSPHDVARSLERRDGLSREHSLFLWLAYVRSALVDTRGRERCLVFYEELMENWEAGLQQIAGFLGMPECAQREDVRKAIGGFIDQRLHHHHTRIAVAPAGGELDPYEAAVHKAEQVYLFLRHGPSTPGDRIIQILDEALEAVRPEVSRQRQQAHEAWRQRIDTAIQEITDLVPSGATFILVDGNQLETGEAIRGRLRVPFLERGGQYWGPPPDDATAIQELERLRQAGASYMVFGWPAFWWLEHYAALRCYLQSVF
jgi:hypothetical protein